MVGGGISGLGVAYALHRAKIDVYLLEGRDDVGGVIRSESIDGYLIESGPNSALNNSLEVEGVLGELGLLEQQVFASPAARKRFIIRDTRPLSLPTSPIQFVTTSLWSARAKWRLLAEPFIPRATPEREETVTEFFARRLGREVLDYAVDPFVSGVYAGDPNVLSIRSTFPTLYALERDHGGLVRGAIASLGRPRVPRPARRGIYSFRTGMAALPLAIAERLGERVWRKALVMAMTKTSGGFRLDVERAGTKIQLEAERVVLATPADRASLLVRPFAPALAAELGAVVYAPVAVVFTGFLRGAVRHPLDGFGCLVPSGERRWLLGSLWNSTLFPGRAPEGMVACTNYLGGARHPEVLDRSDDELLGLVTQELSELFGTPPTPAFARVIRHTRGIPQYLLGHAARLGRIEGEVTRVAGLSLVGNYGRGVAVGECLVRGLTLGREVAAAINPASRATNRSV